MNMKNISKRYLRLPINERINAKDNIIGLNGYDRVSGNCYINGSAPARFYDIFQHDRVDNSASFNSDTFNF